MLPGVTITRFYTESPPIITINCINYPRKRKIEYKTQIKTVIQHRMKITRRKRQEVVKSFTKAFPGVKLFILF